MVTPYPCKPTQPLVHLATKSIDGQTLRFFWPPDVPDFPWTAWDDLCTISGLSSARRREITAAVRSKYGEFLGYAPSDSGAMLIAVCHAHARGLVEFLTLTGEISEHLNLRIAATTAEALTAQMDGMTSDEVLTFIRAALQRMGALDQ